MVTPCGKPLHARKELRNIPHRIVLKCAGRKKTFLVRARSNLHAHQRRGAKAGYPLSVVRQVEARRHRRLAKARIKRPLVVVGRLRSDRQQASLRNFPGASALVSEGTYRLDFGNSFLQCVQRAVQPLL